MDIRPGIIKGMRLYHYTTLQVETLLSNARLNPGQFTGAKLKRAQSISFFFDPVPLDLIAGKYSDNHPAWKPGSTVYENEVTVMDLPMPFSFEVVETPSLTKLADEQWNVLPAAEYRRREDAIHTKEHTRGDGLVLLARNILKFRGGTRKAYQDLFARKDFKRRFSNYYAATVPHVLLWPPDGEIAIFKTEMRIVR